MAPKLLAEGVAEIAAALPPFVSMFMQASPADVDACPCGAPLEACVCVVPCGCGALAPIACRCLADKLVGEVVL